jgi:drug/metabolite transporter (DMT)-like permease
VSRNSTWLRLMMIAFFANGIGPFGLKIMAEKGLSEAYHFQYLLWWYGGGLIFCLGAFLLSRRRMYGREVAAAFGIGAGSFGGQLFSLMALEKGVPGYIVFPITTGGNLFLVAAAGVFFFRERVGRYGIAGIFVGVLALVLLSLG